MVSVRLSILSLFSVILMFLGVVFAGPLKEPKRAPYVSNEILVKFKKDALLTPMIAGYAHQLAGATVLHVYELVEGLQHIRVPLRDVRETLAYYRHYPGVEYAEPNFIVSINDTQPEARLPNDERFSELWNFYNVGQVDSEGQEGIADADIDAPEAWETSYGDKNVIVGIIDTGIDYTHPELAQNIWVNKEEIRDNNIDDDQNGFVDDVYGYDFYNSDGDPMDDNGHGTHVSGIVAAVGNNGVGVVGVAPNVSVMAVKFLSSQGGGKISDAVLAVEYAAKMKAHILNNSWGGGGFSRALDEAIEKANKKGIVFTAAAGNDGLNNDVEPHYPSGYNRTNVIAVASTNNRDVLSGFSNYGFKTVHVAAPGENILSTIPGNEYTFFMGTSMATPHVSGVAALLLSLDPHLTSLEIRERIMKTSDEINSIRRKISSAGRLNAYNAIHNIESPKRGPEVKHWIEVAHEISTPHDYQPSTDAIWTIVHRGATYLKVYFSRFDTEENYDFVVVTDKQGNVADQITGPMAPFWSYVVEGDTIHIHFKSDNDINRYGFDSDKYAYSVDFPK